MQLRHIPHHEPASQGIASASIFYLVVAFIGIFASQAFSRFNIILLVFQLTFVVVWSFFVTYVKNASYSWVSWIVALIPFIMFFIYK